MEREGGGEKGGFFFRFEQNRIAVIPAVYIQSRCAESARPHRWPPPAPPHYYPFSLSLSLPASLPLALSPRNEIMVIDYPTWKPPSGISITYVCIPTGNLPLIRSNSAVTQFTPASNLKWDCLMAQGTIEMGFSDFAEPRSPFGTGSSRSKCNPVILVLSTTRLKERTRTFRRLHDYVHG